MKVSVITISYNANQTIEKTLNSVANQSYKNIEYIIVDGGSMDNTLDICNSFPHVSKIISEPDNGVYDAFNKGLKLATAGIRNSVVSSQFESSRVMFMPSFNVNGLRMSSVFRCLRLRKVDSSLCFHLPLLRIRMY